MIIILIVLIILYVASFYLASSGKHSLEKLTTYECGLEPLGDARLQFKIVYYIIGILYLLFDLEIVFLYPLAVSLNILNSYIGFLSILFFFILLTLAFIYEWYQGALDLENI